MGCYEPRPVDESDHHALMYVWHGQTVREDRVGEASAEDRDAADSARNEPGETTMLQPLMLRLTRTGKAAAFAAAGDLCLGLRCWQLEPVWILYVYYCRTYEKAESGGGREGKRRTCAKGHN